MEIKTLGELDLFVHALVSGFHDHRLSGLDVGYARPKPSQMQHVYDHGGLPDGNTNYYGINGLWLSEEMVVADSSIPATTKHLLCGVYYLTR